MQHGALSVAGGRMFARMRMWISCEILCFKGGYIMRKSLEYKILVSVLALGILSINNIVFANSGGYYDNYNNYIGSSTTTQGSGACYY